MQSLAVSLRRAVRRLFRTPAFTVAVVATLAIGLGATTAIFALVNAVLLRPLPYANAERLVLLRHTAPGFGIAEAGQSDGTYLHYARHNRVFENTAVYLENEVTVTDGDEPERVPIAMVSPSLFSLLHVRPALGRLLTPADAADGAPNVAVISHGLWVRRFGADPRIIGRTIELNRSRREVVGVLPSDFAFPRAETQMWYPLGVEATKARVRDLYLTGVALLKPGVTPGAAEADLRRLLPSLAEVYPDASPDLLREGQFRPLVVPLREAMVRDVRPALVLLLYTAAFVLLVAWANVANLVLVRADGQRKDVAVERALGASPWDMARRFLGESAILATLGGALALAVASVGVATHFGFGADQIPRLREVRVDGLVVAVAVGLALLSGVVMSGAALIRMRGLNVTAALKAALGRATAGRSSQRVQRVLVATQVALALTLLIVSAMMIESVVRLRQAKLGFDARSTLTFDVALPFRPYPSYRDAARFHLTLADQIRALPGVSEVGATSKLPLTPIPTYMNRAFVTDAVAPDEIQPSVTVALATTAYFETMRMPVLSGRALERGDAIRNEHPVVVSNQLARTLFRGTNPVGRRVRFAPQSKYPWYTIVGVVGDVPGESIPAGPRAMLYFPVVGDLQQTPDSMAAIPYIPSELTFVVRSTMPPLGLLAPIRRIVREVDPRVPIINPRSVDQVVAASTARVRLTTLLLLVAAATTLFLGLLGLYSVVSYAVSRRTPELGVRLALGASPAAVGRLVMRQGAILALVGIGVGLAGAYVATRLLRGLLYQVNPGSPLTYLGVSVLLLLIAIAASHGPARRASRIDPASALKAD